MVRLLLLILALSLSGCNGSERERALEQALEQQRGAMEAKIAELERRASIAQACDYILPVCPASMTEPGYEAIRRGYSGGGFIFWALVAAKLVALLVPIGLAIGAGGRIWAAVSRPALEEAEQARKLIAEAEARAEQARHAASTWAERARQAKAEAEAARQDKAKALAELAEARAEVERLAEARKLLTGL